MPEEEIKHTKVILEVFDIASRVNCYHSKDMLLFLLLLILILILILIRSEERRVGKEC